MKTKQKSNLTTLAILTMLTLLTWVAIEAYQKFITRDPGNIPPEVLAPLKPTLDKTVLDLLESRKNYTDDEISQFNPSSKSISETVTTNATQSAQVKTASQSAQAQ